MPLTIQGYRELRRDFEACQRDGFSPRDPRSPVNRNLRTALREGHLKPSDFSLRELFQYVVSDGFELLEELNPNRPNRMSLLEAGTAVDTSAFSNITGQIVYTRVMEDYMAPGYIGESLVENIPTSFDGEKIPGITDLGDVVQEIKESERYPTAGVSEFWIETPQTKKRGIIVPVTKEAIFFDRTGDVLRKAGAVGEAMRISKEKRILDTVLGITTSYRRNGGTAQATYGDSHTNGDFDNLAASNALVDWTDIEAALLVFDGLTNPDTGEPIMVMPTQIIVPSALFFTAKRIVSATEIREGSGAAFAADPTDNIQTVTISGNPIGNLEILSNPYVKARTSSASTWFIGEFRKAFAYMENWPMTVTEAPVNSEDEFHRDVVAQWKVSERGAPAVLEPRAVVKCTA